MGPSKWLYHAFPQKLCVGEFNSVVRVIQGITFSLFEASKKKKKKKSQNSEISLKILTAASVIRETSTIALTNLLKQNFTISPFPILYGFLLLQRHDLLFLRSGVYLRERFIFILNSVNGIELLSSLWDLLNVNVLKTWAHMPKFHIWSRILYKPSSGLIMIVLYLDYNSIIRYSQEKCIILI